MNVTPHTCPTCDSDRPAKAVEPYEARTKWGIVIVPEVPRYRCADCGEELFDAAARRTIDRALAERRRRRCVIS